MTSKKKKDDDCSSSSSFDYVIVGAGPSCMGLLWGLLEPFPKDDGNEEPPPPPPPFSIAVIERGGGGGGEGEEEEGSCQETPSSSHDPTTLLPRDWFRASHNHSSSSVSCLQGTVRGKRVLDVPTGKGIGGTSNINACLCIPPARQDFETWPEPWKSQLLSCANSIQQQLHQNGCLYHSTTTASKSYQQFPVLYDRPTQENPIPWKETIFPSSSSLDIPCCAAMDTATGQVLRRNYYDGLVAPLLEKCPHLRDSIHWFHGHQVERLLFSDTRQQAVVGVECFDTKTSSYREIRAQKEVIVCAGAIETPALLLVSGIGLDKDLEKAGIPSVRPNFAGAVGHRLRDHVTLPIVILTRYSSAPLSVNGVARLHQLVMENNRLQFALMDATAYPDVLPHAVAGLVRWRFDRMTNVSKWLTQLLNVLSSLLFWTIKTILYFLISYTPLYLLLRHFVSAMLIFLLNPSSEGHVGLKRKRRQALHSTGSTPLRRSDMELEIELGYLDDEADVTAMLQGVRASRNVVAPAGVELFPGPLVRKPTRFQQVARLVCLPYFHWSGTCPMFQDGNDRWVVDSKLRVRGDIQGLRICDASVCPTMVSAPTALTCAALGMLLASILANEKD